MSFMSRKGAVKTHMKACAKKKKKTVVPLTQINLSMCAEMKGVMPVSMGGSFHATFLSYHVVYLL